MSLHFPSGAIIGFSTALDAAVIASAVSNADPAVATATGIVEDDVVVVTASGWPGLVNRVAVAGEVVTDSVPLNGIDTSDTAIYPALGGAGSSLRTATAF